MPAMPELRHRTRLVGRIEVLREHESEHQPEADCHVGVAAEIEVDLKRVGRDAVPGFERTERAGVERKIGDLAARVRQEHLFRQAEGEERDAPGELRCRMRPPLELVRDLGEPDDRAGDQLREHRHEACEIDEAPDRRGIASIHVDRVTHRLERVEADPQRKGDPERGVQSGSRKTEPGGERVEILRAEVVVLEKAKQGQIADHRYDQRGARRPCRPRVPEHHEARDVVDRCRDEHQRQKEGVRPPVEDVAEDGENQMLRSPRRSVIEQKGDGKKVEEEEIGAENHKL